MRQRLQMNTEIICACDTGKKLIVPCYRANQNVIISVKVPSSEYTVEPVVHVLFSSSLIS